MSVKRICVSKHPVDRDDAVARLENYESEIFRTDGIHRKQLMAAVAKCVDLIADMPVIEAVPVEFIEAEIKERILANNTPETREYAMHIYSIVNTWRKKAKTGCDWRSYEPMAQEFIVWACEKTLENDSLDQKPKYLRFLQDLIDLWREEHSGAGEL